jgi:murein DD-endopeptidase MepM/ murein hydrolase activator NlpD/SH3-like domain-containing protein
MSILAFRIRPSLFLLFLFCNALLFLSSCGGISPLKEVFQAPTPHERYEQGLRQAKLANTALGRDWIAAGQKALRDSLQITLPFRETGYFAADKSVAYSLRLQAQRGEKLVIRVETKSLYPVQVFIDIFDVENNPKHVASADTNTSSLEYKVEKSRMHLIRIQPELLRSGRYTISIEREPGLAFPLPGKDSRNISSFWGSDRDGGKRQHEGIDIFAKRGTPVVAASAGTIRGVNQNNLGGKVVWLSDESWNQSLYYAHLDQQLVTEGQHVNIGDTLGLVGNTGNAATTDPHLHFGIYRFGEGAIDPFPFVQRGSGTPPKVEVDLDQLGQWNRVAGKKAALRRAPNKTAPIITEITPHTPLLLVAGAVNWYRALLPNGVTGYVSAKQVESFKKPLRKQSLPTETALLDYPDATAAPMQQLKAGSSVTVLADSGSFLLVETPGGERGWMSNPVSLVNGQQ